MFFDILRVLGIITGIPAYWILFKRKTYYEDKKYNHRCTGKGALIISNHYNALDYVLNTPIFFPRKLNVVASEFSFRNPLMRFLMKFWGGIKADRITKNPGFILKSARVIKKGHIVQIFPEGHNTDDGTIKAFYPSYIVIALKAKAPIIPVISDGNYGLFKRTHVIIGNPINPYDYLESEKYSREDIQRLNEIVHQKVLDLREDLDERMKKGQ